MSRKSDDMYAWFARLGVVVPPPPAPRPDPGPWWAILALDVVAFFMGVLVGIFLASAICGGP